MQYSDSSVVSVWRLEGGEAGGLSLPLQPDRLPYFHLLKPARVAGMELSRFKWRVVGQGESVGAEMGTGAGYDEQQAGGTRETRCIRRLRREANARTGEQTRSQGPWAPTCSQGMRLPSGLHC